MLKIKQLFCRHNYIFKKYELEEFVLLEATTNPKPILLKPQKVYKYYFECLKCRKIKSR